MTVFRPCIDLHDGQVKQIVGGSLSDDGSPPVTNYIAPQSPASFARMYKNDQLTGGHVIKLGPGNEQAAKDALAAWPNGLQLGGGITDENAQIWLDAGAAKLIVTSWLFSGDELDMEKTARIRDLVGRDRLVIDLSCRRFQNRWFVATRRWQHITHTPIDPATLDNLSRYCSEYLIHAADVEGKCQGIDLELVTMLGQHCPIPCTYAGGANSIDDLVTVRDASEGRIDLTFGSALDLFGGTTVKYKDCVAWNLRQSTRDVLQSPSKGSKTTP